MKKLFCLVLALMMASGCLVLAHAENADVLAPLSVGEINTANGVYLADFADLKTLPEGGYAKATLYQPDYYPADKVTALQAGSKVLVGGQQYTVKETALHDEGEIEIIPEEEIWGYIVFKPHGDVYSVVMDDEAQTTPAGEYTLMMPLPDSFRFLQDEGEGPVVYNADQLITLITSGDAPDMGWRNTVLAFSNGAPILLGCQLYTISDADEERMWMEMAASEQPQGTGGNSFTLTVVTWDSVGVGKTAVPEGYYMEAIMHNVDDGTTCLGSPIQLDLELYEYDGPASMFFHASETYTQVKSSWYYTQVEGAIDEGTKIRMRTYTDADGYCATLAAKLAGCDVYYDHSEGLAFFENEIVNFRQRFYDEYVPGMMSYGLNVEWLEVTAAHNVYTFERGGQTWAVCVMAEVRGYEYSLGGTGAVQVLWDVPAWYGMVCPLSDFEKVHDTFAIFVENTAVSDAFIAMQDSITEKIKEDTINAWNSAVAASMAYAAAMDSLMTQYVNDYLSAPRYSTADRFSDYIFDQNNYVTSDGYSVKVSTSYDYVWDTGGGYIGYSTSAFDVPAGAELLYPSY